jgi:hypothetical protein
MTDIQKTSAINTAVETLKKLIQDAPNYGSIGLGLHFRAGVLIRTTTSTEKSTAAGEVQNGQ